MAKKPPQRKSRTPNVATQLAEQKANAARGMVAPAMTPQLAAVVAKLLHAGCPMEQAVTYCHPQMDDNDAIMATARLWAADSQVIRAVNDAYGATFMDLEPAKRFELALNKSLAEMAFFLWNANWVHATSREDLEKMKQARETLKAALGQSPDEKDPMQAFARFMLEYAKAAMDKKKATGAPAPKSLPLEPDMLDDISTIITSGRTQ